MDETILDRLVAMICINELSFVRNVRYQSKQVVFFYCSMSVLTFFSTDSICFQTLLIQFLSYYVHRVQFNILNISKFRAIWEVDIVVLPLREL